MSYDRHHRMTVRGGRVGKRAITLEEAVRRVSNRSGPVNVIGKDEWGQSKTVYTDSLESLTNTRLRLTRCRFYAA